MTDYGHELVFGSFVTPTAARPQDAVGLAQFSESVGLDLVTFQDHPYQPGFLDTWTLLSFVAARTSVIRLAANVTNLPLRPPAVLARGAASLDLLSGGRFELGLGSGAFWDAIEAMGAQRLSPGDAVQALEEAIEIIRGTWDVEDHSLFRVDGEFHHVHGAKRGPAPAHDIEIWLGAYKPRMLRLTGARADGWLPSLAYLDFADLAAGNAIIDEAAVAAGRRPGDIRRMLNLNAELAPEELAELTLRDGVSTFVLGRDDPDALERFGREIAPAVRELVSAARAPTAPAPSVGPAAVASPAETAPYVRLGVTPTPDDGVRLSATSLWDESARPSRPNRART